MVGTGLEGVREETGGLPVGLEAPGRTSEGEKSPEECGQGGFYGRVVFGRGWVINRAQLDWAEEERGCILLRGGAVFLKVDGSRDCGCNPRRLPGGCGLMRTEWKECLHGGYKFGAWDMGQYRGVECEDSRGDPGM